jgi:hypothetical protein
MDSTKSFALILIGLMVISSVSLLAVKPTNAQTVNPSVPEFTVKYIPANDTYPQIINIIIKNQPFVPPDDLTSFNFNVRYKGHSQENWTEVFIESIAENRLYVQNTSSENTLIPLYDLKYGFGTIDFQGYSQIDFQVEAVIATFHPFAPHGDTGTWTYETSGWSPTQTVTIPASSTSTLPSSIPTSTAAVPELSWLAILPLFVFLLLIAFKLNRTPYYSTQDNPIVG